MANVATDIGKETERGYSSSVGLHSPDELDVVIYTGGTGSNAIAGEIMGS